MIREDARRSRDVSLFDVGNRTPACGNRVEEILHLMSHGRRSVLLEVLFGLVLRVLFELVGYVTVNWRLTLALRDKIVAVDAQFQRSFVTVDCRAPGIFRVGRISPGAMLPDYVQSAEVKGRSLS